MTVRTIKSKQSGVDHLAFLPDNYLFDGTVMGGIFLHGVAGSWESAFDLKTTTGSPGLANLVRGVAAQYPIATMSCNARWANDDHLALVTATKTYLQATRATGGLGAKAGKIFLIGQSMGALAALVWASQHLADVACIIGLIPVADLNDMWTADRANLRASIDAAYPPGYSTTTDGPVRNPRQLAQAGSLNGLKYQANYASNDSAVIVSTVTGLVNDINTSTGSTVAVAINRGATGHTDTTVAAVPVAEVLAWIAAA